MPIQVVHELTKQEQSVNLVGVRSDDKPFVLASVLHEKETVIVLLGKINIVAYGRSEESSDVANLERVGFEPTVEVLIDDEPTERELTGISSSDELVERSELVFEGRIVVSVTSSLDRSNIDGLTSFVSSLGENFSEAMLSIIMQVVVDTNVLEGVG